MRTARKLAEEFYCCESVTDFIKQIQLAAIKEGMRRAAKVSRDANAQPMPFIQIEITQAILTAAEQLTEKDL